MTRAYEQALKQAKEETAVYLDQFTGLKEGLSVEWERDEKGGTDGNRKTIQCNRRNGKESYYEYSIPLPYGEYVIAEQISKSCQKNWQTGIIKQKNQERFLFLLCRRSLKMRIRGKRSF